MPFFNPMQNQANLLDELSRRLFQERGMYGGGMGGGMQPTANLSPVISAMSLSPMEQALAQRHAATYPSLWGDEMRPASYWDRSNFGVPLQDYSGPPANPGLGATGTPLPSFNASRTTLPGPNRLPLNANPAASRNRPVGNLRTSDTGRR